MATYRFSSRDGTVLPDLQISEHGTLVEARREAVRIVQRLAEVEACSPAQDWVVDVADEDGLTLFSLTVSFIDSPALGAGTGA